MFYTYSTIFKYVFQMSTQSTTWEEEEAQLNKILDGLFVQDVEVVSINGKLVAVVSVIRPSKKEPLRRDKF